MRHFHPVLLLVAVLSLTALPATAQIVLPGAVAPTPEGVTVSPNIPRAARLKSRLHASDRAGSGAPSAKVPPPSALSGQTLFLNGRKSQVTFESRDKAMAVSHLVLSGERLSNPRDECQVEVPEKPIATTDLGKPNGLSRIQLASPACPIVFDVLDGAALAVGQPSSCEFKEADCRVNPAGLWGPQPGSIGPDKSKGIERARAQAEAAVRTDFKLLLTTTKDKSAIIGYAREQAGFSSAREEICRDYAGEGRHGLCAAKLTEARAAALRAKFEIEEGRKQLRKKSRAGG